jgi:hypothetical protein
MDAQLLVTPVLSASAAVGMWIVGRRRARK